MRTRLSRGMAVLVMLCCAAAQQARADHIEHVVSFDERQLASERVGEHDLIALPGCDVTREVGRPQLPVLPLTLALPPGSRVLGVELLNAESTELIGRFSPMPVQHPRILPVPGLDVPEPAPVGPDPSVYGGDRPYPADLVALSSSGLMDGTALVSMYVHPIQFLPRTGKLRLFRTITLRVTYEVDDSTTSRARRGPLTAAARTFVDNEPTDAAERRQRDSFLEQGTYEHVIIVGDSSFEPAFAPLVEWKTRKGVPSRTVTMSWIDITYPGLDAQERLRNFVADASGSWGATWFLLAGETDLVPARRAYAMTSEAGGHPDEDALGCDGYYGDLDGSWDGDGDGIYGELTDGVDMYPDVFIGRAPVRTPEEASIFVDKLLEYERAPESGFALDMLMAAEVLWTDPFTDSGIALNRIDRESVPPCYDPINKLYETLGNESAASVREALNNGPAHFLHSGHAWYTVMGCGDGAIYRYDALALTNQHRQPVVYSIGCWPAAFDLVEDCIAERFLQNPGGGAVAFVGNSRYGWASPGNPGYGYSERFMQEFYRMLFVERLTHAGSALAAAKASFIPFSQEENVYRWHQYQLNLLGDPEMPIWTAEPADLLVSHADSVVPGTSVLAVSVRTAAGPLENARVCITNGGDVYERALTSPAGLVELTVDTVQPDSLHVTVTSPDCRPYEAGIPVTFSGPYMRAVAVTLDDTEAGNGDGLAGPGETVEMVVDLCNFGNSEATSVTARLSGGAPVAVVTDGESYYGDISGGATATGTPAFTIGVAGDAENGQIALFEIGITSDAGRETWSGAVSVTVSAPVLTVVSYSIDDTWGGDGDGFVEPGEDVRLMVELANEGLATALAPVLTLTSDDAEVSVVGAVVSPGDVAQGSTVQAVFDVSFGTECPEPSFPELTLAAATSDGLSSEESLTVTVGSTGFAHDFESGPTGWTHAGVPDVWTLTANRSHSGAQSWYAGSEELWQYPDGAESELVSPDFIRGVGAELTFWCWYEFPIYHEDGFYVEVMSGADVDTLDFIGSGGALDVLGTIGNDWLEYRYALPFEVGDTLRVRFRFTSDEDEVAEGVYVDDVSVTATAAPSGAGVPDGGEEVESTVFLHQNHPNPFSPTTMISYTTRAPGDVQLLVYNIQGRLIRTLADGHHDAGDHEVSWDGKDELGVDVAAGVYLYRLTSGEEEDMRKMILIR